VFRSDLSHANLTDCLHDLLKSVSQQNIKLVYQKLAQIKGHRLRS